ncbi:MAG TPA: right-handed parallel beta-helix repeat-containing protein, partial [Saprospiraceae bacterium]|nr:right-handed parallel beta-helix repeat-containing protein [Saprospiraceae bacterium]HRP41832.1 right-handed parallel beta-helix repeat-containing protein [Saprospiraceae bacterium]
TLEVFCSIQSAIDDAQTLDGHTLSVAAGTYNENITLNKDLTLSGVGATTILTPSTPCSGTGILISAAGATVQNLHVTNYNYGLAVTTSGVLIDNVESIANCNAGINLGNGTTNLTIQNSKLNNNTSIGFRKGSADVVSGFTMVNCEVKGNKQGCFIAKNNGAGGTFDYVSITNSDFSNNLQKGMYFEALSNAVIDGIIMNNSGTDATNAVNNGIDINLKYGAYSNITIQNSEITNCGYYGTSSNPEQASAVAIKARDDSPYSGNPATLSNVTVSNNIISGPQNGIRTGEFGKVNAGPAITVQNNHLGAAFAYKAFINNTNSNATLECNWWGSTGYSIIDSKIIANGTGTNDYNPWLVNGTDDQLGTTGFQPVPGSCTGTPAGSPELTTTFLIDASNFALNQSRDALYYIENVSNNPTNSNVQIVITKPSGGLFNTSIPSISNTADVFGGIMSNNSNWSCVDYGFFYLCTSAIPIPAMSNSKIKIVFTATGVSNSQSQTTGQLLNGTGGDQNLNNNYTKSSLIIN